VKYLLMFVDKLDASPRTPEEREDMDRKVAAWWQEHAGAGQIVGGQRLQGPETATTVDHVNGSVTVTDGPFLEAKESIGGFAVLDVADLDEALVMARTWPPGGKLEVRPLWVDPG
jgi:hypothetical protein